MGNVNKRLFGFSVFNFFSRIQASYDGDLILIQKLIKDGAKVNHIHLQRDRIPKYFFLFDRIQISPLRAAIMGCHVDCIQYLISQGADVNATFSGKKKIQKLKLETLCQTLKAVKMR
jgi:ankyrin repeat protein